MRRAGRAHFAHRVRARRFALLLRRTHRALHRVTAQKRLASIFTIGPAFGRRALTEPTEQCRSLFARQRLDRRIEVEPLKRHEAALHDLPHALPATPARRSERLLRVLVRDERERRTVERRILVAPLTHRAKDDFGLAEAHRNGGHAAFAPGALIARG